MKTVIVLGKFASIVCKTRWLALVFLSSVIVDAAPTVTFRAVPPNFPSGCVFLPVAQAVWDTSNSLTSIKLEYSFSSSSGPWTVLAETLSPHGKRDTVSNHASLENATGTIFLRASATDAAAGSDTEITSVTITGSRSAPSVGTPSLIVADTNTYHDETANFHSTMYNYGVAWMYDGTHKAWWTGMNYQGGDGIMYAYGNLGKVAATEAFNRDGKKQVSNPDVKKGSFSFGGSSYSYAMYYTGETSSVNHVGLAFSSNGTSWTDAGSRVTTQSNTNTWGAGIPSVIKKKSGTWGSSGHAYIMFNYDITQDGATFWWRTSSDGVTWSSSPTRLTAFPRDGQNGNEHWGVNPVVGYYNSNFYIAYVDPTNFGVFMHKVSESNLLSGSGWGSAHMSLGSSDTFYVKHNPGFFRDEDGYLYVSGNPSLTVSMNNGSSSTGGDINESQIFYVPFSL